MCKLSICRYIIVSCTPWVHAYHQFVCIAEAGTQVTLQLFTGNTYYSVLLSVIDPSAKLEA